MGLATQKDRTLDSQAEKDLKDLPKDDQALIVTALRKWKNGHGCPDLEKIKSQPSFFRFRASCFRIIYYPLSNERVVLLMIRNRKSAYRGLGDLRQRLGHAMLRLRIAP
jgi:mRNA interferase RelE/StbE